MSDQKCTATEKIKTTMACASFAEAGEPCPLSDKEEGAAPAQDKGKSMLQAVKDDLACTAFYDQNEECPIESSKKEEG